MATIGEITQERIMRVTQAALFAEYCRDEGLDTPLARDETALKLARTCMNLSTQTETPAVPDDIRKIQLGVATELFMQLGEYTAALACTQTLETIPRQSGPYYE